MTQRRKPTDGGTWLKWVNLAVFWAIGIGVLIMPTAEPNQYGHKICAIGALLFGIVLFKHPVQLGQPVEITGELDSVDRVLLSIMVIVVFVGLAVRYAHDL